MKIPQPKTRKVSVKKHPRKVPKGITSVKKHKRTVKQKGLPTARKQIRKTIRKTAPIETPQIATVGQTILIQINTMDRWARARWGARDMVTLDDGVQFRVSGSKHRGKVIIKLNPLDTYDIEIGRMDMKNLEWKSKKVVKNIYVDQLIPVLDGLIG